MYPKQVKRNTKGEWLRHEYGLPVKSIIAVYSIDSNETENFQKCLNEPMEYRNILNNHYEFPMSDFCQDWKRYYTKDKVFIVANSDQGDYLVSAPLDHTKNVFQ